MPTDQRVSSIKIKNNQIANKTNTQLSNRPLISTYSTPLASQTSTYIHKSKQFITLYCYAPLPKIENDSSRG